MILRKTVNKENANLPEYLSCVFSYLGFLVAHLVLLTHPVHYHHLKISKYIQIIFIFISEILYLSYHYQFSSVTQSCLTLCDPMNHSTPGLPVHHQLLEITQTHIHRVGDAIQPSHPLSVPFSSCPQSLPALGSSPMGQLFT